MAENGSSIETGQGAKPSVEAPRQDLLSSVSRIALEAGTPKLLGESTPKSNTGELRETILGPDGKRIGLSFGDSESQTREDIVKALGIQNEKKAGQAEIDKGGKGREFYGQLTAAEAPMIEGLREKIIEEDAAIRLGEKGEPVNDNLSPLGSKVRRAKIALALAAAGTLAACAPVLTREEVSLQRDTAITEIGHRQKLRNIEIDCGADAGLAQGMETAITMRDANVAKDPAKANTAFQSLITRYERAYGSRLTRKELDTCENKILAEIKNNKKAQSGNVSRYERSVETRRAQQMNSAGRGNLTATEAAAAAAVAAAILIAH